MCSVKRGRRYRFDSANSPHGRALTLARGGTIYKCMGNDDPAHSLGNVLARAGEMSANDVGWTSNALVFEAHTHRIFKRGR